MTDATRYPLSWPFGWKRTRADERKASDFSETTVVTRGRWNGSQMVDETKRRLYT